MRLSDADKDWIESTIQKIVQRETNSAVLKIAGIMPRGILHTVAAAAAGFVIASLGMDIKNKDIPHISYPMAELERVIVESAGTLSIWTGGFMADYNRMFPSLTPDQVIIGLTDAQASDFMRAMRMRESSNRYHIINPYGYLGAYSMGAGALADIGYINLEKYKKAPTAVKRGTNKSAHLGFLQNPNNWARYSYEKFMQSEHLQNRAFIELANLNIERAFKGGILKRGDHKRLAGFAAAAHLVGYRGAERYYGINIDSNDRNGATASEYAELGERSIKGAPPIDVNAKPYGLPMDKRFYTRISSGFGFRRLDGVTRFHGATDFPVPVGTPTKATADGKVIFAGDYKGACGYGVKIQHSNDYTTIFCHLSKVTARSGEWIRKGAIIGLSGGRKGAPGSGSSRGAHIHYAIKLKNKAVDPELFISGIKENPFAIRADETLTRTRGGGS